jgi:hypothetical protein
MGLAGCSGPVSALFPTYVPTLGFAPAPKKEQSRVDVPVTYAAEPVELKETEFILSDELEPTPTLRSTAISSPTPLNIAVNYRNLVEARFLDVMPDQIPCDGPGFVFKSQFPSKVGGNKRDFHGYLPPCYGIDGRSYQCYI